MIAKFTPTLVICAVGAAVTGALLGLPPAATEDSTAPPASLPAGAPSVQIAEFQFGARSGGGRSDGVGRQRRRRGAHAVRP